MITIMYIDLIEQLISEAKNSKNLDKGAYLFHQGDPVSSVFIVAKGVIELTRYQLDGKYFVLQRASCKSVVAEASLYSDSYHCDGIVAIPSEVFIISKKAFLKRLQNDNQFSHLWQTHLAREVQSARYKSEILSRKTVTERLDGWLAWHENRLPPKGQWKSLATQIGVSHEALYREMAKGRIRGAK